MPIPNKEHNLMIKCECHGHLLEINNDITWLDDEPYFNVSIWNQDPYPMTFWDRIKLIFRLIRGKTLEGGDVLLKHNDIQTIIDFLTKELQYNKNHIYK